MFAERFLPRIEDVIAADMLQGRKADNRIIILIADGNTPQVMKQVRYPFLPKAIRLRYQCQNVEFLLFKDWLLQDQGMIERRTGIQEDFRARLKMSHQPRVFHAAFIETFAKVLRQLAGLLKEREQLCVG